MRRHLLFQLLLTGLLVIVLTDPAGAQRRAFGGGLLGAGIGGAAGGKKGAAIGGAVGLGLGLIGEEKDRKRRRKKKEQARQREQAYQQQQLQLQQQRQEQERQIQEMQQQRVPDPRLVKDIESELQALGYRLAGEADGIYTAETRYAIESYQYNSRLQIDGLPSAQLLDHLSSTRASLQNAQLQQRIESLEQQLSGLDYRPGPADGVYTTQTRAAIESYQYENGLQANGRPTQGLLEHVQETHQDAQRSGGFAYQPGRDQMSSRELVFEIQLNLKALELDPGPIDGLFGAKTERAILTYQALHGMVQNGQPTLFLLQHLQATRAAEEGLKLG